MHPITNGTARKLQACRVTKWACSQETPVSNWAGAKVSRLIKCCGFAQRLQENSGLETQTAYDRLHPHCSNYYARALSRSTYTLHHRSVRLPRVSTSRSTKAKSRQWPVLTSVGLWLDRGSLWPRLAQSPRKAPGRTSRKEAVFTDNDGSRDSSSATVTGHLTAGSRNLCSVPPGDRQVPFSPEHADGIQGPPKPIKST
jgi:hypothetical protein